MFSEDCSTMSTIIHFKVQRRSRWVWRKKKQFVSNRNSWMKQLAPEFLKNLGNPKRQFKFLPIWLLYLLFLFWMTQRIPRGKLAVRRQLIIVQVRLPGMEIRKILLGWPTEKICWWPLLLLPAIAVGRSAQGKGQCSNGPFILVRGELWNQGAIKLPIWKIRELKYLPFRKRVVDWRRDHYF